MLKKLTAAPLLALFAHEARAHQYSAHNPDFVDALATLTAKTESVQAALDAREEAARKGEFQAEIDDLLARGRAAVASAAADKECIADMLTQITAIEEQIKRHHQASFNAENDSETAQAAAEAARDAAVVAQGLAEAAEIAAEQAQTEAETAETAANTTRIEAESAATAAEVANGLTQEAVGDASAAEDASIAAEGLAMTASSGAEAKMQEALASQLAAEAHLATAETQAGSASNSADAAATSAMNAAASQAAAEVSQGIAEYQESLALYYTFRHETDFDYLFRSYPVWISQLDAEFKLLFDSDTITGEVPHPFTYDGTNITNGQCQTFEFKGTIPDGEPASICHGSGYFTNSDGEFRVLFNQGSIVKVLRDSSGGERTAFTCRDDCKLLHGPFSLISGGSTKQNIMYEDGITVGSDLDTDASGAALWYDTDGNIVRGKADNALSNFCAGIAGIEFSYKDYCPSTQVIM